VAGSRLAAFDTVVAVTWRLDEFERSLTSVASATLGAYRRAVTAFVVWCERAGLTEPDQVTRVHLRRYLAYLTTRRYARRSIARAASSLRRYFAWLRRTGAIAEDPARTLSAPKGEARLPRVLRTDELHTLLEAGAAPAPVHRFFAALPPLLRDRGIPHQLLVTTGYDLALEQALLAADEEFDVVSYVATGRHRGRFFHRSPDGATRVIDLPNTYATELSLERRTIVLKLHGGVDTSAAREQESFVVTEDDYISYLARNDVGSAVPVGLAARLRRSHFLFLGYGMREWGLRLVLDRISNGEPLAYRSWAVVPEARPLERQFWQTRGVDLLEQPPDDYVEALASYVGLGAAEATA